jgi:hypothetical protein
MRAWRRRGRSISTACAGWRWRWCGSDRAGTCSRPWSRFRAASRRTAAGGVLIWHLRSEWAGDEIRETSERRAYRLVGGTFMLLAALVSVHALASLAGVLPEAQPSTTGIVLIVASAVVMTALYVWKTRIARRMHSHALESEARQALYCDLQDVPVIAGLAATAIAGWWWADPLVALLLVPLFVREGMQGLRGESCGDDCAQAIVS